MILSVWTFGVLIFSYALISQSGHQCPTLYIIGAAIKQSHSHCQVYYKYLQHVMSEALRRSLDYYYDIALLIGQWAELIIQMSLLLTTYAFDRQQVIYLFYKMRVKVNTQKSPACPHTFSFGGTCTLRDWHLGVQAKICGYTFWKSVIGVHTSTASRLIHGNSLYHYDQRSFLLPEFAFAKVCNFIVGLRLICSFRQLNLLC